MLEGGINSCVMGKGLRGLRGSEGPERKSGKIWEQGGGGGGGKTPSPVNYQGINPDKPSPTWLWFFS